MDKRSIRNGIIFIILLACAYVALRYVGVGGYISAWFVSIAIAFILLAVLSIPRYLKVNNAALEIHCVVELTTIRIDEIKSIRKIEKQAMKFCIPVLGCFGFFGYYGYFLNLRRWEMFKVYASEWKNFVEIENIYEDRFVVNCSEADNLIKDVLNAQNDFKKNAKA